MKLNKIIFITLFTLAGSAQIFASTAFDFTSPAIAPISFHEYYTNNKEHIDLQVANGMLELIPGIRPNYELYYHYYGLDEVKPCNAERYSPEDSYLKDAIEQARPLSDLDGIDEVPGIENLKVLVIENNDIPIIPESIGKLTSLRNLKLSNNQITKLPDSIGNLKQLNCLDLSFNRLVSLPSSLEKLYELEILNLSGNDLTTLPSLFKNLPKIKYFDVRQNPRLNSDLVYLR